MIILLTSSNKILLNIAQNESGAVCGRRTGGTFDGTLLKKNGLSSRSHHHPQTLGSYLAPQHQVLQFQCHRKQSTPRIISVLKYEEFKETQWTSVISTFVGNSAFSSCICLRFCFGACVGGGIGAPTIDGWPGDDASILEEEEEKLSRRIPSFSLRIAASLDPSASASHRMSISSSPWQRPFSWRKRQRMLIYTIIYSIVFNMVFAMTIISITINVHY